MPYSAYRYRNRNEMPANWQYNLAAAGMDTARDLEEKRAESALRTGIEARESAADVAGIQAGAQRYGAELGLEGVLAPKTSYLYEERRAKGGLVDAKRPYLVGEKGPELMVPEQNGRIVPNHKLQMLARRGPVPRAAGGPVVVGGAPDDLNTRSEARQVAAQNRWLAGAAPHAEYKKNLMRAAAEIDPTGERAYHQAATLGPLRAEREATLAPFLADYDKLYRSTFGVAELPKPDTPEFQDYHGGRQAVRSGGLEAGQKYLRETQAVRQYEPLFSPEQVAEGRKNPTFWRRYVLEHGPQRAAAAGPRAQPRKWWQGTPIQEQRPIDWGKVIPPATETVPPM